MRLAGEREARGAGLPVAVPDPEHFKLLPAFEERFAAGPPSLVAERLEVAGDVAFGAGVAVRGRAVVRRPGRHPGLDGAVLEG